MTTYRAYVVRKTGKNEFTRSIENRAIESLPENDILVRVQFSSLNYKDALSATGNPGVTRHFPHTPGIDAAGVVKESASPGIKPGSKVIVHGYDLGMETDGGFGQYIRVPADWVVHLPEEMSLKTSMTYGTAGFTAAMAIEKMAELGVHPDSGDILVTGATGGVGSLAIALLGKLGYRVIAATGKPEQREYLQSIGASDIISREETDDQTGKALLSRRWAGAIDTVGGNTLSTVLRSMDFSGVVASCGNARSGDLNLNVYPFILRGVNLRGVDSGNCDIKYRQRIWNKLAAEWSIPHLDTIVKEITLEELDETIDLMLNGKHTGRTVINLWKD